MKAFILISLILITTSCHEKESEIVVPIVQQHPELDIIGKWRIKSVSMVSTARYSFGKDCGTLTTEQMSISVEQVEYDFQQENRVSRLMHCPDKIFYYNTYSLTEYTLMISTGESFSLSYENNILIIRGGREIGPGINLNYTLIKL